MTRTIRIALLMALCALSAFAAPGQESTGLPEGNANLYAVIFDEQGNGLPGVTFTLKGESGEEIRVSDAKGYIKILRIAEGVYPALVELEGFWPREYPAVHLTNGRNTTMEITLYAEGSNVFLVPPDGAAPVLYTRSFRTISTSRVASPDLTRRRTAVSGALLRISRASASGSVDAARPFTASTVSPTFRPAVAAGLPATTSSTR